MVSRIVSGFSGAFASSQEEPTFKSIMESSDEKTRISLATIEAKRLFAEGKNDEFYKVLGMLSDTEREAVWKEITPLVEGVMDRQTDAFLRHYSLGSSSKGRKSRL